MKQAHKHLLVAACVAVMGLSASAQTPPAPGAGQGQSPGYSQGAGRGPGPMMGSDPARMQQRMERMQERMAQRLAAFKERLQITPAQEGAWSAWTAALKPAASSVPRPDRAEMARLTTPERIDRMRALRASRAAEMDRRGDATKTFYAALSPEQQKTFDAGTARTGKRGMRGHHGGGWFHHRGA
jgi:periplasmic protein CpxP/Spy